jgi:NAD(P)H-hydrate epimerase
VQVLLRRLNRRARDAHKGDFGRVLVVGGSIGMVGAPALTANAALRTGTGLVKLACPRPAQQAIATLAPCATSVPMPADTAGRLAASCLPALLELADAHDVLAVGPGADTSQGWQKILAALLKLTDKPVVVDADGLNNLAGMGRWWQRCSARVVLTPHPGEMRRLLAGAGLPTDLDDRQGVAAEFAELTGCVVMLKGHRTVIADGRHVTLNPTGNPGMATAGAGDVLTGIIAGLLAQGFEPFDAARFGAWLHGRAGDLAAKRLGQPSMIATDILDELPHAIRS